MNKSIVNEISIRSEWFDEGFIFCEHKFEIMMTIDFLQFALWSDFCLELNQ